MHTYGTLDRRPSSLHTRPARTGAIALGVVLAVLAALALCTPHRSSSLAQLRILYSSPRLRSRGQQKLAFGHMPYDEEVYAPPKEVHVLFDQMPTRERESCRPGT